MFPHQAVSSRWPPPLFQWLTWTWKMNRGQLLRLCQIQQETGPSSVKSSLQRDGGQIWTGQRHFHPGEISWPLFYVLGHKDQVKHYHNKHYRGKWCSTTRRDSSPDIRHHSHVDSSLPAAITGHPRGSAVCGVPLCPVLVAPRVTHLAKWPYTNTNTHAQAQPFDLWGLARALNTN